MFVGGDINVAGRAISVGTETSNGDIHTGFGEALYVSGSIIVN